MNVCVLCFVLPPANGSIRLGKAEVRQDRLRVGGIGSTFTNISALWRNKSRYGHASVWSSIDEKRQSAFFKHTWFEGLHSEGAQQIKYLRSFMDDMQPQLGRPCQEILPADNEDVSSVRNLYSETAHYTVFIEGKFSAVPVPLENRTARAAHSPGCSAAECFADRGYTGGPGCNK